MENNFETNNEQNENVNFESRLNLQPLQENVQKVKAEIAKVIVGQNKMIDQLLVVKRTRFIGRCSRSGKNH